MCTQTAGCNAGTATAPQSLVEAAARKLPRGARGMDALTTERYAGKRPARHFKRFKGLKPVKRQPWTPIRSHCCGRWDALSHCCGLVVAFACGHGACWACWGTVCLRSWAFCMCNAGTATAPQSLVEAAARKLPRGTRGMDALTTERYAGKRPARHFKRFKGLKPVKRQPWTPIRSHCCGRGDALSHCCGLAVAFACRRGACWACWGTVCLRSWAFCMREWRVLGLLGVPFPCGAGRTCRGFGAFGTLEAGMARVGLVGVPFACGAGRTFGGFGAFGASWRLLGLLGYLLPAKLGVLHAGVCGAGRTFGGFGAFGAFEACQTAAWNAYKKPLLRPGGCLEPLLWPCGGFCLRAWRLLGLLGYRLPAKLGVLHAAPQSLVDAAARKLPRGARGMDALTTERYAGKRPARHFKRFKGLKPVKRQRWTPIRSHGCGRGDALSHCCGLVVAFARPNNRALCRQTAGEAF